MSSTGPCYNIIVNHGVRFTKKYYWFQQTKWILYVLSLMSTISSTFHFIVDYMKNIWEIKHPPLPRLYLQTRAYIIQGASIIDINRLGACCKLLMSLWLKLWPNFHFLVDYLKDISEIMYFYHRLDSKNRGYFTRKSYYNM